MVVKVEHRLRRAFRGTVAGSEGTRDKTKMIYCEMLDCVCVGCFFFVPPCP